MACKPVKNPKVSHNNIFSTGGGTWKDYFSDNFFEDCAKSDHWRTRLIEAMSEFGQDKNHCFVLEFCAQYKMPRKRLYILAEKHPDIKEAFDDMKLYLGFNRCLKVPLQFVMQHDQYRYDPEWDEGEIRKAELTKKTEEQKQNITVIMSKPEVTAKE
jgi:hypothetical protein